MENSNGEVIDIALGQLIRGMIKNGKRPEAYKIYVDARRLRNSNPDAVKDWLYNMVLPSLATDKEDMKPPLGVKPFHLVLEEYHLESIEALKRAIEAHRWEEALRLTQYAISVGYLWKIERDK